MPIDMPAKIINARQVPYREMLAYQRELFSAMVERKKQGLSANSEQIILVEHPPVYTLGRHGHRTNLLVPEQLLLSRGAELVEIERGGDITFHGPGQIVAYPIIDLERRRMGVKQYVWSLEQAVIDTCDSYGIEAHRVEGATGVWIEGQRKVCAIGVKCSRFITMHGLALNVNTDLDWFRLINPCGFTDKGVTSLQSELGRTVNFAEARSRLATALAVHLDKSATSGYL